MRARRVALFLSLVGAVAVIGCGSGGPPLVKVEGTVTFDGKPLENAELTFVPDQGNTHVTPGSAVTAADGSYKARYMGRFGLAEGAYKITFRKMEVQPDVTNMPQEMLDDPAQLELGGFTRQALPEAYADISKTAFDIQVTANGGPYDFELDSKGR
ncbi:hypothetical protein [Tautonia sociabilis]|uniref:NEAT domain-containing protein n=1 Tax=Tautonia sociabilis TaxID=2080755 RepID=A0A432MK08_9BACT|nr:hypothetical protein [Tautonia sociabilis]RUL87456.1 hypothetical protein TsocGM_12305 [Tautonia sociabilis]